MLLNLQQKML